MTIDQILSECVARRKADPTKTPAQIVGAVMDELAGYKTELAKRPEFKVPEGISAAPIDDKQTELPIA